jgi:methylphosphotriester-DNA--protein-cysteine methyltransferase
LTALTKIAPAETDGKVLMIISKSQPVISALHLFEDAVAAEHSFTDEAAQFAIAPRTSARTFNAELGMTWDTAVRRLRMMQAMKALSHEARGITGIACGVGNSSTSAFNAALRDFTDHIAIGFRKSLRA